jgi:hypothetical protein
MRSIDVETNVFALIWSLREDGEESENSILSRVLSDYVSIKGSQAKGLQSKRAGTSSNPESSLQRSGFLESLEVKSSMLTQDQVFLEEAPMGKIRWVDDVFAAIRRLGGSATLHSIYREVEVIRRTAGRSVPKSLDATVRRTIEDHSSDSDNHRGPNLFAKVGRGEWAIRRDRSA